MTLKFTGRRWRRWQAGEDGELLGGTDVVTGLEMAIPTQIAQPATSG